MTSHLRSALVLATAVAALSAGPLAAAPADIARAPDLTFTPCQMRGMPPFKGQCPVLGYGDLNGDGQSDVVVEQRPDRQPGDPTAPAQRTFLLLVSPFQAPDGPRRIQVRIEPGEGGVNLTIADVDGDGMDDVAFASLYRDLNSRVLMGHQRVALVMGRATFAARYELGRLDVGAPTLRRTIAGTDIDAVGQIMLDDVRVAFGDVDGDGHTDVVLGNGTGDRLGVVVDVEPARPDDDPTAAPAAATVAVAFGPIRWDAATVLTPAAGIADLGACANALGGVADVTGDGIDDVVFTRCPGRRLPDALGVLPGSPALAVATAAWRTSTEDPIQSPGVDAARADADVPPPGEPGRGYLSGGAGPDPLDRPLFFDDVDADGVRDIVLGFGANAHVWLGGDDIAARLEARRTDRVIVGAGFGALARTRGWRGADMDGDGVRDLLLVQPARTAATNAASGATVDPASEVRTRVEIYAGERAAVDVLDTDLDAPDAIWQPASLSLDGMADINGDGFTDLVWSFGSSLSIHYGPLFRR